LAGAVFALPVGPREARGQTDEQRSAARAAATEGVRAFEAGRYQEALDYCKRAEAIMHAPTHLLLIARASAKLGKLVEAQEAYFRIQRDSLAPDAPPAFLDAQRKANDEQAALAPRVPSLKVELEGGTAQDVTVTLDGAPLPAALIGIAAPVNPGDHALEAKGAHAAGEPTNVTIAEGAHPTVTLVLKPVAASLQPGAAGEAARSEAPPSEAPDRAGMRIGGWLGLGVGAAGVVAGTLFALKNRSNRNDANALCNQGCPESKRAQVESLDSSADSAATAAWISYGVGGAALATGAVLLWMSGNRPAKASSAQVTPWLDAHATGAGAHLKVDF
jgi:hypothetical protein